MRTVCAWCGKELRPERESLKMQISRAFSRIWEKIKGRSGEKEIVSHGICDSCKEELLQE